MAGLAVSLFAAVTGEEVQAISTEDLVIAALIAVVPGGLGHFVSTHPLSRVAANIPPVMQLAMPFLSGGLAWLLLRQPISLLHVIGGLATIAGVVGALISPGGRRQRSSPPRQQAAVRARRWLGRLHCSRRPAQPASGRSSRTPRPH